MIEKIFKKYLIKIGDEIKVGSLTVELPSGEILNFSGKKGLVSNLKLNSYRPLIRTIIGGHLGFAESYLREEWTSSNLESFLEIIPERLAEGNRVKLGEFGTFRVNLKSTGNDLEEDVSTENIIGNKIVFNPGKMVEDTLKTIEYKKVK